MRELIIETAEKVKAYLHYKVCSKHYKQYLLKSGYPNCEQGGESVYIAKWKQLSNRVEPYSYRFFSHFCGQSEDIVPEDVGNMVIERHLNPPLYRYAYADKNLFPTILGKDTLPKTVLYRVNGGQLLSSNNLPLNNVDIDGGGYFIDNKMNTMILKPTVGSCSGRGIEKISKGPDGLFYTNDKKLLTKDYLLRYGKDFCLQESIVQSDFMSNFCPTSVNTIRMATYKSVIDDEVHIIGAIIRIGKLGAFVDNAHAGGVFVGVDTLTGNISNYAVNEFGERFSTWNGINLEMENFTIPNWDGIVRFSKMIGQKVLHHRLLALDIALRQDNSPVLIEYNIGAFSYWLFMLTGHTPFGRYTDEIIDYCKKTK